MAPVNNTNLKNLLEAVKKQVFTTNSEKKKKFSVFGEILSFFICHMQCPQGRIQCIWVRIRGAFLAKKGAPKLSFHREGDSCPYLPPKSATEGPSPSTKTRMNFQDLKSRVSTLFVLMFSA